MKNFAIFLPVSVSLMLITDRAIWTHSFIFLSLNRKGVNWYILERGAKYNWLNAIKISLFVVISLVVFSIEKNLINNNLAFPILLLITLIYITYSFRQAKAAFEKALASDQVEKE